ncbi:hypothetical protein FHX14_005487 [Rhizobium sp. BK619]|uniref:hypothetical protein n=1 Tax=Rhizobium sp. BK619 TaxID=2586989 RepID=UPI00161A430B|nr:hypothetical protein [Rhizobium sp. BK619]MBB3649253.1 hypothetical protein [Rhizobium sp. BK619]
MDIQQDEPRSRSDEAGRGPRRLAIGRAGGDFAFASDLLEKRRQLAGIEMTLATDIEGLDDAGAKAA